MKPRRFNVARFNVAIGGANRVSTLLACIVLAIPAVAAADFTEFVDTKIGGSYRGHTFPGAACPFGMVQASPDTGLCDWDHCSGYVWEDPCIYGFSQTHLSGTGCPDLADVRLLPFTEDFDSPTLALGVLPRIFVPSADALAFTRSRLPTRA